MGQHGEILLLIALLPGPAVLGVETATAATAAESGGAPICRGTALPYGPQLTSAIESWKRRNKLAIYIPLAEVRRFFLVEVVATITVSELMPIWRIVRLKRVARAFKTRNFRMWNYLFSNRFAQSSTISLFPSLDAESPHS